MCTRLVICATSGATFDLVELVRQQQQQSQLQALEPASSKQMGVLQCVAKLNPTGSQPVAQLLQKPSVAEAHESALLQHQEQAALAAAANLSDPIEQQHDYHSPHPQVLVIPSGGEHQSLDDELAPPPYEDQLDAHELEPPVDEGESPADLLQPLLDEEQQYSPPPTEDELGESFAPPPSDELAGEELNQEDQPTTPALVDDIVETTPTPFVYQDRRRNSSRRSVASKLSEKVARLKKLASKSVHIGGAEHRRHLNARSKRQVDSDALNLSREDAQQLLANSLAQMITRALMNRRSQRQLLPALLGLQQQQQQPNNQLLIDLFLSNVAPVGQQLASTLVRQTVNDLPVRMANMGQLLANLITTLTIQNPLLTNEPVLVRTRNTIFSQGGNNNNNNQNILVNILRALSAPQTNTSTTMGPLEGSTPAPFDAAEMLQLAASQRSTNSTGALEDELQFVQRLNGLTLGQTTNNNNTVIKKALNRKKRGLGSAVLLGFGGPFGKFYTAMLLRRMMKFQSSLLSQAIMGELIRRFMVPTFTSALSAGMASGVGGNSGGVGAGVGQLFTQLRQALTGGGGGGNSSSSTQSAAQPVLNFTLVHQQQQQATDQTRGPFAAECQFVASAPSETSSSIKIAGASSPAAPVAEPIKFMAPISNLAQLVQLMRAPVAQMLASAVQSPAIKFDPERGLTINLPISQSNLEIPSQRALMRTLAESIQQQPQHQAVHPNIMNHYERPRRPALHDRSQLHHRHRAKNLFPVQPPRVWRPPPPQALDFFGGQQFEKEHIGELLKQASPELLVEMLNKMNNSEGKQQQLKSIAPATTTAKPAANGDNEQAQLIQALLASVVQNQRSAASSVKSNDTVAAGTIARKAAIINDGPQIKAASQSELTNELLNKTLTVWLDQLLASDLVAGKQEERKQTQAQAQATTTTSTTSSTTLPPRLMSELVVVGGHKSARRLEVETPTSDQQSNHSKFAGHTSPGMSSSSSSSSLDEQDGDRFSSSVRLASAIELTRKVALNETTTTTQGNKFEKMRTNEEVRAPRARQQLQQQQQQQQVSTLSQPFTTLHANNSGGRLQVKQQQQQQQFNSSTTTSAPVERKVEPATPQKQPLDNLAMALNVMNMVMLNQRLLAVANNSAGGAPPSAPVRPVVVTGNLSLITHVRRPPQPTIKLRTTKHKSRKKKKMTTTTLAPEFVLINNSTMSNHRTSTNSIRPQPNLIQAAPAVNLTSAAAAAAAKVQKYVYQPLVESSSSSPASGFKVSPSVQNAATIKQLNNNNNNTISSTESVESEQDHAIRWNDVLKHLNFRS